MSIDIWWNVKNFFRDLGYFTLSCLKAVVFLTVGLVIMFSYFGAIGYTFWHFTKDLM